MKRDKKFYINAIKMDLFRVVTATGDTTKNIPTESVKEFLDHASSTFKNISLNKRELKLKSELEQLASNLDSLDDPLNRLRWAEQVLTIRTRL